MELEEAIEHAEQKAQDLNCSCREDHRQLALWLKELQARREAEQNASIAVQPSLSNNPVDNLSLNTLAVDI